MLDLGLNLVETTNALIEEFDVFFHSTILKAVIGDDYQAQIFGLNLYKWEKLFEIQIKYFDSNGIPFEGHDDVYAIALNNCSILFADFVDLATNQNVQDSLGWWSNTKPKLDMKMIINPTSVKDILKYDQSHF
jgi:hypothetical protein